MEQVKRNIASLIVMFIAVIILPNVDRKSTRLNSSHIH